MSATEQWRENWKRREIEKKKLVARSCNEFLRCALFGLGAVQGELPAPQVRAEGLTPLPKARRTPGQGHKRNTRVSFGMRPSNSQDCFNFIFLSCSPGHLSYPWGPIPGTTPWIPGTSTSPGWSRPSPRAGRRETSKFFWKSALHSSRIILRPIRTRDIAPSGSNM